MLASALGSAIPVYELWSGRLSTSAPGKLATFCGTGFVGSAERAIARGSLGRRTATDAITAIDGIVPERDRPRWISQVADMQGRLVLTSGEELRSVPVVRRGPFLALLSAAWDRARTAPPGPRASASQGDATALRG